MTIHIRRWKRRKYAETPDGSYSLRERFQLAENSSYRRNPAKILFAILQLLGSFDRSDHGFAVKSARINFNKIIFYKLFVQDCLSPMSPSRGESIALLLMIIVY